MDLFAWLSADQSRYLWFSETAVVAFATLAIAGACSTRVAAWLATRAGIGAFCALAFVMLLVSRWPTLFLEANPMDNDTAEFVAQALMALHHPLPWHDFDGLTSGPYNTYVVMLPALFGAGLSFESTDLLTLLLDFVTVVATYGALALCFDHKLARLGTVPLAVFWAVTVRDEYVYYTSELFSAALGAVILWLFAYAWRRRYPRAILYAAGVLGGMLPLA